MTNKTAKASFNRDGFIHIPNFLGRSEVSVVLSNLDRLVREDVPKMDRTKVFYENAKDTSTLKQLIDIDKYDSFFNDFLHDGKFKNLASFLLGDEVTGRTVEYFNKPARIGKATPPHQDGYYFMLDPSIAITMWIALEPADEENGCVSYIKGSHLAGMRPHGRTATSGFSQQVIDYGKRDMENEAYMRVQPGDLLAHHSLTIHSAGANLSTDRSRKALGLIYFGNSAKEDIVAKAAYQKQLQEEDRQLNKT